MIQKNTTLVERVKETIPEFEVLCCRQACDSDDSVAKKSDFKKIDYIKFQKIGVNYFILKILPIVFLFNSRVVAPREYGAISYGLKCTIMLSSVIPILLLSEKSPSFK